MSRDVVVSPERLECWFDGFFSRNGELDSIASGDDGISVTTSRGALALIRGCDGTVATIDDLVSTLLPDGTCVVVLVRRGGYSVATATFHRARVEVTASKTGSRYVQGRTAAGGQSQQRFARRRDNQAAALIGAAVAAARTVLGDHPAPVDLLITGGDHLLLDEATSRRPLSDLNARHRTHVEVGEPRRADIDRAIDAARSVTIAVTNARPEGPS